MNSKNSLMISLISLVGIISLIAIIFSVLVYFNKDEDVDNEEIPVIVEKQDKYQEFKDILDVINLINTDYINGLTNIYVDEINISDIDNNRKIYSVINRLLKDEKYEIVEKPVEPVVEEVVEETEEEYEEEQQEEIEETEEIDNTPLYSNYNKYINKDDVKRLYMKIYGEIEDFNIDIVNVCPIVNFIEDKYYINDNCERRDDSKLLYYIDRSVKGVDTLDLYVYLGLLKYNGSNYSIYSYNDLGSSYKDVDSEIFFSIDKTNYKDFTEFRLHFKKKDKRYFFDSVRKV